MVKANCQQWAKIFQFGKNIYSSQISIKRWQITKILITLIKKSLFFIPKLYLVIETFAAKVNFFFFFFSLIFFFSCWFSLTTFIDNTGCDWLRHILVFLGELWTFTSSEVIILLTELLLDESGISFDTYIFLFTCFLNRRVLRTLPIISDGAFCENSSRLSAGNYFCKTLHLKRLTGFWICICKVLWVYLNL